MAVPVAADDAEDGLPLPADELENEILDAVLQQEYETM